MKIGIVTVYDSANFGSYLQSYALHLVLSEMGHEVYFISNPTPDKPYTCFRMERVSGWQGKMQDFQQRIKEIQCAGFFSSRSNGQDHIG